jgi:hypothetical protein
MSDRIIQQKHGSTGLIRLAALNESPSPPVGYIGMIGLGRSRPLQFNQGARHPPPHGNTVEIGTP